MYSFILHTTHCERSSNHSGGFLHFCRSVVPAIHALGKHLLHSSFPKRLYTNVFNMLRLLRCQWFSLWNGSGIQTSQTLPLALFSLCSRRKNLDSSRLRSHPQQQDDSPHQMYMTINAAPKMRGSFAYTSTLCLCINVISKVLKFVLRQNQSSSVLSYYYNWTEKHFPEDTLSPSQPNTPCLLSVNISTDPQLSNSILGELV